MDQTSIPPPLAEVTVTITAARLAELEAAEAKAAELKEKLYKRNNNNPERLAAYNKANPDKQRERTLRYIENNRETINARRREKYLKKKLEGHGQTGTA